MVGCHKPSGKYIVTGDENRTLPVHLPKCIFEKESFMKKVFSTILVVAILLSMTISAYATEVSDHLLEEMSVPEAMSNAEIVNRRD